MAKNTYGIQVMHANTDDTDHGCIYNALNIITVRTKLVEHIVAGNGIVSRHIMRVT